MKYQVTSEDLAHEVLRGELFNALHEGCPALVRTVASRLGVSLGALRKMANEGKLTSAVVLSTMTASPPGESLESRVTEAMDEIKGWSAAAFRSAALQPEGDEFGRRFIEHGAMCYANCVLRIQTALGGVSLPPSATPSGLQ